MFGLDMQQLLIAVGGGIGGLAILLVVLKFAFSGGTKKTVKKKEVAERENLEEFPKPPPLRESDRRLLVDGLEVRLRLVIVAPAGVQAAPIPLDDIEELLEDFMRGLSKFLRSDKPRVRSWPGQISAKGFAPTFFRLVESPDPEGKKSHWIRLAGPARAAGEVFLIGLAFWSEDPSRIGSIEMTPSQWIDRLRIER